MITSVLAYKGLVLVLSGLLAFNGLMLGGGFLSPPKIFAGASEEWQEVDIFLTEKEKSYVFSRDGVSTPSEPEGNVKIKYREKDGDLEIEYSGQRSIDVERVFEIIQKHEKEKASWWSRLFSRQ